jgi:calcineurin-like phosphoesterase family protein
LLKDPEFHSCFDEVHHYLDVDYNGTKVVMLHYPIAEWDQMHRGAVHFHGHLHGGESGMEQYRCRDMGIDAIGQIAMLMEDAIRDAMRARSKGITSNTFVVLAFG